MRSREGRVNYELTKEPVPAVFGHATTPREAGPAGTPELEASDVRSYVAPNDGIDRPLGRLRLRRAALFAGSFQTRHSTICGPSTIVFATVTRPGAIVRSFSKQANGALYRAFDSDARESGCYCSTANAINFRRTV